MLQGIRKLEERIQSIRLSHSLLDTIAFLTMLAIIGAFLFLFYALGDYILRSVR